MPRTLRVMIALAFAMGARPAEAQVSIGLQWLYNAESLFLSDFDPFSLGRQPDLVAINIMNGAAGTQNVVLELRVTQIQPENVFIFEGESEVFTLGTGMLRLTNRDLATRNGEYAIEYFDFGDQAENMNERLRQTGRFPAGRYEFAVRICSSRPCGIANQLAQATVNRDFVNPTRVDLLGPGRPFGSIPPVVTSPAPRFLWTTDTGGLASGLGMYRIRVARVDESTSPEEAMQGFPVWEAMVNATSAIYPGSAQSIPLVPGGLYAWQVVREVQTSGGIAPLESPIYWFRMNDTANRGDRAGSGGEENLDRQINQLAEQLGLGGQLTGFQAGNTPPLVDGRPASREAVEELLRRIISGEATVLSITVR